MNAVLHENTISCYEVVCEAKKSLEVSGESVVPDKMADIGILCDTRVEALLQSKDVLNDGVSVRGELRVSVSYIPDGKSGICGLNLTVPWEAEFQVDSIPQGAFPVVDVRVEHVETRMLNPRKILFKGKLLVSLCVYDKQSHRLCDGIEGDGTVLGCMEQGTYSIVSTVCERTFAATDEYPIPPSLIGAEIVGKSVAFRIDDIKTLVNKLIVKGTVESDVLLSSDNGEVEQLHFSSGFSFIAETECERVSDDVAVSIVPTAVYYEITSAGKSLSVEVHGVCQMVVYDKITLHYVSDAFSNFYPCECSYGEMKVLENRKMSIHREKCSGSVHCRSQVDKVCYSGVTYKVDLRGERGSVRFAVLLCVKYENGQYDRLMSTTEYEFEGSTNETLNVRLWDVRTVSIGNEVEYHITFDCEVLAEEMCRLHTVTAVHYDEQNPFSSNRASIVAVHAGGRLWDLARQYGSTVEQIKAYNQIDSDEVPHGTFLLIPKQRLH